MTKKEIDVYFRDGEQKRLEFPEKLYDLPWSKYRKLERKIKMNAQVDRDGEIQTLDIDSDKLGEFLVEYQNEMAKLVLDEQNIDINDVTTRTVKNIIQSYGDDMEELGLELKKKGQN